MDAVHGSSSMNSRRCRVRGRGGEMNKKWNGMEERSEVVRLWHGKRETGAN